MMNEQDLTIEQIRLRASLATRLFAERYAQSSKESRRLAEEYIDLLEEQRKKTLGAFLLSIVFNILNIFTYFFAMSKGADREFLDTGTSKTPSTGETQSLFKPVKMPERREAYLQICEAMSTTLTNMREIIAQDDEKARIVFRFFASGLAKERHAPFALFYLCQLAEQLGAQTYNVAQRKLALPQAPVASRYEIEFSKKHKSKSSPVHLLLVDVMEGRIADEAAFNVAQVICQRSERDAKVAARGYWICPKCKETVGSHSRTCLTCYTRMPD